MNWVSTGYTFDLPTIRLKITRRVSEDLLSKGKIDFEILCCNLEKYSPQTLAIFIQDIVTQSTDLKGVVVVGMEFDFDYCGWIFVLSHPSFPRTPHGEKIPVATLVPEGNDWWLIVKSDDDESTLKIKWKQEKCGAS